MPADDRDISSSEGDTTEAAATADISTEENTSASTSESASTQEEAPAEIYPDSDKVAAAYLSTDTSGLSDMELELYNIAVGVIDEIITEGMSHEDMCVAIHDYIVTHGTYDKGVLNVIGEQKPYSHLAYGFLTVGEGICSGYTMTFKMFADMLGIENIVVHGNALTKYEEHAWNMVKLEDGNWYHVDCTWDDFVPDEEGRPPFHIYMFLDDETLASDVHFWDRDAYPKAESMDLNYYKTHGLWFENEEDIRSYAAEARRTDAMYAEIAYPASLGYVNVPKLSYYRYQFEGYYVLIFIL